MADAAHSVLSIRRLWAARFTHGEVSKTQARPLPLERNFRREPAVNKSTPPGLKIPGHVVALSALAGCAALLAYALYDRPAAGRIVMPERPVAAEPSRADLESWATSAQQKVLGTGRLTARESPVTAEAVPNPAAGQLTFAERPVTRTVTHVGASPRREPARARASGRDGWSYSGPSLANLPPPGD